MSLTLTPEQRVESYDRELPWPAPAVQAGRIYGIWLLGNDYRGSGYYGAYPPNYLRRVMALFPDATDVLHLFSGSLPQGRYTRLDSNPDNASDVVGDAHELAEYFPPATFDLIVADPPYSAADAKRYGMPMVNRKMVLRSCASVCEPGGCLVWLDVQMPMFRKVEWKLLGLIGVVRSCNHRVRMVSLFQRVEGLA